MADIFISYSSKDRAQAEQLTELLASAGLSVWIDQSGIDVATSWSGEISKAITECKALIVLLSPSSVDSKNVTREVALAFERNKKILPLDLEPVTLPDDFAYHLAGVQRTSMTNIDSIIRALGKIGLEATQPPTIQLVKETDSRKSLMILPFKDLSPTADNAWFADGIVSELIDSLSHVRSLRLVDKQTTSEYKTYQGHLTDYAREMRIRYFLEGDVRKFGDQIKISCILLDIETTDHLWQISHKGTMSDIFDMQEELARKVVDGLKVHLLASEEKKLSNRGTTNAEAYEMYLKAEEFFNKRTKVNVEYALTSIKRALDLDPAFPQAMLRCAIILITTYQEYGAPADVLEEADRLLESAKRVVSPSDDWRILGAQALRLWSCGDLDGVEAMMRENIRIDPSDFLRHNALGFFYSTLRRFEEASVEFEAMLAIAPDSYRAARSLIGSAWGLRRRDRKVEYAYRFLDKVAARISTMPDDDDARIVYGLLLVYQGRFGEARAQLEKLPDDHIIQEESYRNLAGLAAMVGESERAMHILRLFSAKEGTQLTASHLLWFGDQEFEPIRDREDFIRLKENWTRRVEANA